MRRWRRSRVDNCVHPHSDPLRPEVGFRATGCLGKDRSSFGGTSVAVLTLHQRHLQAGCRRLLPVLPAAAAVVVVVGVGVVVGRHRIGWC